MIMNDNYLSFEERLSLFYYNNKERMANELAKSVKKYKSINLANKSKATTKKIEARIDHYQNLIAQCKN